MADDEQLYLLDDIDRGVLCAALEMLIESYEHTIAVREGADNQGLQATTNVAKRLLVRLSVAEAVPRG